MSDLGYDVLETKYVSDDAEKQFKKFSDTVKTTYKETGDIYLVADVLGHKDVNTTRKHYAQIDDDRRKMAAKVIKLRDA